MPTLCSECRRLDYLDGHWIPADAGRTRWRYVCHCCLSKWEKKARLANETLTTR